MGKGKGGIDWLVLIILLLIIISIIYLSIDMYYTYRNSKQQYLGTKGNNILFGFGIFIIVLMVIVLIICIFRLAKKMSKNNNNNNNPRRNVQESEDEDEDEQPVTKKNPVSTKKYSFSSGSDMPVSNMSNNMSNTSSNILNLNDLAILSRDKAVSYLNNVDRSSVVSASDLRSLLSSKKAISFCN